MDLNSASYLEIFPIGQPFKCLYAIHAIGEYVDSAGRQHSGLTIDEAPCPDVGKKAKERAMTLVLEAIGDPDIIDGCPEGHLRSRLSLQLMSSLVRYLVGMQFHVPFGRRWESRDANRSCRSLESITNGRKGLAWKEAPSSSTPVHSDEGHGDHRR